MEKLKQKVAEIGLKMYTDGLVSGTSGNISLCHREKGLIAITPSGMDYRLITASDIVVVGFDGKVQLGCGKPSSETPMHMAIYRSCPQVHAVVHTHSPYATAFAVLRKPIPCVLIEMDFFLKGAVPISNFAPAGSEELGVIVAKALQNSPSCLLSNHGVVAIGETLEQAYLRAIYVEDAAKIYHLAKTIGEPIVLS